MNSTFDPLVGQVLDDRYEIVAKVARGGMATVYRARDRRLSRVVAVKVMRSDLGEDDEFAAKFDREARSAAVLSHPNVVSVFDQGISQGQPYIVMEFIEGETLRRVISREAPLPPEHALELFEQVAGALVAAHEAGVVHRDIKPENVMITARGQVKVADFGLAREVDSPQMTATGVLVGTASYLPPELVTHARPDGRSDVYSAGVMLFEMLTGKKPHTGENNYQIAYRHVHVDIEKPSERLEEIGHHAEWSIPDYIDALVLACVARDPRARLADGRDLLGAVRKARQELVRTAGRSNPSLAAALLPASPSEPDGAPARPVQRPRPAVSPQSPSRQRQVSPQETIRTSQPAATAPTMPAASPPEQPRSQRTPVFPQLHISQDPVYRRRRGVLAMLLVLLLTVGVGFGAWWWMTGRFTTVPTLTNLNEAKAREAAAANALEVQTSEKYSETVAKGLVVSTDPGTGQRVLRGGTVNLVISKGAERYPMPKVAGLKLDAARTSIQEGNMRVGSIVEKYSDKVDKGHVISTKPKSGTPLKPRTAITLTVSKGRQPIRVPNVVGSTAEQARGTLKERGFDVTVKEEHSPTAQTGTVARQDPPAGVSKHRGDTVTIVKSLGPAMVTIPALRYKPVEEATKTLEGLGFKVEVRASTAFPISSNLVHETSPGAGSSAPEGSIVIVHHI